jgi:hypothetical protein
LINILRKKTGCFAGLMVILFLLLPVAVLSAEKDTLAEKRIAVIPFQKILPDEGSTMAVGPLGGGYTSGKIERGAENVVEEYTVDKLREFKEVQIIPLEKVEAVYSRVAAESLKTPLLSVLKKTGSELQADVIAVGYVYRFTERVGYDFSAEHPASVVFEIYLLNVSDGSTIWHGVFDKTQKSLMADVFQAPSFFKGGAKWLTANQLAKQGIEEIFKTFSGFAR